MRAALLLAPLVAACAPHPASPADGPTRTGTGSVRVVSDADGSVRADDDRRS